MLIVAAIVAAGPATAAELTGVLAPAAEGKIQCFSPNEAARTCRSFSAYRIDAHGEIENTAVALLSLRPLVIMTSSSPTRLDGQWDCSIVRPEHLDAATFTVDGNPADADQTAKLRAKVKDGLKAGFGREVCATYIRKGDAYVATATFEGVPHPELDQKVIWVSPADGWRIGR